MKKVLTQTEYISSTPVKAGFPNPAENALPMGLDLNQLIVRHPVSTFYMRVQGDMLPWVKSGDIAVIDKSLAPKHGDMLACVVNGEFILGEFRRVGAKAWFVAMGEPIALHDNEADVTVWGVVTFVIHKMR